MIDRDDIYVSYPETSRVHTSVDTYIVADDKTVLPFRTSTRAELAGQDPDSAMPYRHHFEVDRWADAYEKNRAFGYVMSAPGAREVVHVATEIVLARRYGLRFSQGRYQFCKLQAQPLRDILRSANQAGLLDEVPEIRPLSEFLERPATARLIDQAVETLWPFEGQGGFRVTQDRLCAWANQFPERCQAEALELAKRIRIFSRKDFVESVRKTFEHPSLRDAKESAWVPLGDVTDSAYHWSYFLRDEELKREPWAGRALPMQREEALSQDKLPVVFFDDCVGSAGQVETIFATWLGDEGPLPEYHGPPLDDPLKERLRQTEFLVAYAIGLPGARADAIERLSKRGLRPKDVVIVEELPADGLDAVPLPGNKDRLKQALREIGFQLVRSTKPLDSWSDERCHRCELGYGNTSQLVTFWMNVPTFSITAIWSPGTFNDKTWLPLLPRRRRS